MIHHLPFFNHYTCFALIQKESIAALPATKKKTSQRYFKNKSHKSGNYEYFLRGLHNVTSLSNQAQTVTFDHVDREYTFHVFMSPFLK